MITWSRTLEASGAPRNPLLMLAKLVARNFRSLELVEVQLEPLTALVGPNGTGKSAILRAIDFVMGQTFVGGRRGTPLRVESSHVGGRSPSSLGLGRRGGEQRTSLLLVDHLDLADVGKDVGP